MFCQWLKSDPKHYLLKVEKILVKVGKSVKKIYIIGKIKLRLYLTVSSLHIYIKNPKCFIITIIKQKKYFLFAYLDIDNCIYLNCFNTPSTKYT